MSPSATALVPVAAVLAALLAGCGSGTSVSPAPTASTSDDAGSQDAGDPSVPAGPGGVQGGRKIVLLDPGHNGGNGGSASGINKQVPDGRNGTKACNTTGTSTDAGYPEHKFTWDIAHRVQTLLETNGVIVMMTRHDDTSVGPCVDVRGEMAEQVNADAEVSIHADGAPPAGHGFHVSYSAPSLSQSQGQPSVSLATALRDGMRGAGLPTSTYFGKDGLAPRSDLAGLNLARRPAALIECANMRNPQEATMVSNAVGRQRIANAITAGILAWLNKQ